MRLADGASRFLIDLLTYFATRNGFSAVARLDTTNGALTSRTYFMYFPMIGARSFFV